MAVTKELTAGQLSKLQSLLQSEGAITPDMFIASLQSVVGANNVDRTMAHLLFNLVDVDDSGEVTWKEFQDHVLALRREETTEAQLAQGKECVAPGPALVSEGASKHVLHSGPIIRTMVVPSTGNLMTASLDGSVRLWNPTTLEPAGVVHYTTHGSIDAYFDSPSELLLVANCDKSLSLYDIAGKRLLRSFALGRSAVGETELYRQQLRIPQPTPEFTFKGRRAPELDGSVLKRVWEAAHSKLLQRVWAYRESFETYKATTMPLTTCEVSSVACMSSVSSPNAATMYLGLRNGHVDCYTARIDRSAVEGEIEQRLDPVGMWPVHTDEVTQLQCQRESDIIISSGMDSDVHMFHIERGTVLKSLRGTKTGTLRSHSRGVRGFDVSQNPNLLGTFGLERFAILWDPLVGKPLHVLHGHTARIVDLKFSPQSDNMIFTYSDDLTLRVWDMRTLRCIQQLRDQPWEMVGKPASIFYDKLQHRIITCANRLYAKAAVSPEMRQERDAHSMPILCLSYCSKERCLLSMDEGSTRMWNTDNGCLTSLRKRDALRCAMLDASGFSILIDCGAEEVQVVGSSSNEPQMIFNPTGSLDGPARLGGASSSNNNISGVTSATPSDDTKYLFWDAGYWIALTKRWVRFYACTNSDSKLVHFVEPRHQFSSTLITGKITSAAIVGDKLVVGSSLGYMYTFPIGFLAHTEGASARFTLLESLPQSSSSSSSSEGYHSVLLGTLHRQVRPIVWRAGATAAFRTHKIILGPISSRAKEISHQENTDLTKKDIHHPEGGDDNDDVGDVLLAMRSVDGLAAVTDHVVCAVSAGGVFSLWNLRERCELFNWQGSILVGRISITVLEGSASLVAGKRHVQPVVYFGDDTGYIGAFDFSSYVKQAAEDLELSLPAKTSAAQAKFASVIMRTCAYRVDSGALNCMTYIEDQHALCVGTATARLLLVQASTGTILRVLGETTSMIELMPKLPHTEFYNLVMNMFRMEAIACVVEETPRSEKEIVNHVLSSHPLLFPTEEVALSVLHSMSPLQPELFMERLLEKSFQGLYQCLREKQRSVKITHGIHQQFDTPALTEDGSSGAMLATGGDNSSLPIGRAAGTDGTSVNSPNKQNSSTAAATPDRARASSPTAGGGNNSPLRRVQTAAKKLIDEAKKKSAEQQREEADDDLVNTWTATERALAAPMTAKPFARTLPSHQLLLDKLDMDINTGSAGGGSDGGEGGEGGESFMDASMLLTVNGGAAAEQHVAALEATLRRRRSTIHGPDRLPPYVASRRSLFEMSRLSSMSAASGDGAALLSREDSFGASSFRQLHSRASFMRASTSIAEQDFVFIPFPPLAGDSSSSNYSSGISSTIMSRKFSRSLMLPSRSGVVTTHQEDTLLREELRGRDVIERNWALGHDALVVACILERIWVCFWAEMMWTLEDLQAEFLLGRTLISQVVEPSTQRLNAIFTFEKQHWTWLTKEGAERAKQIASTVVRPRLIRYSFLEQPSPESKVVNRKSVEEQKDGDASWPFKQKLLEPSPRSSSYPRRFRRTVARRRHSTDLLQSHCRKSNTSSSAARRTELSKLKNETATCGRGMGNRNSICASIEATEKMFWSRAAEPVMASLPIKHELTWAAEWCRAHDFIALTDRAMRRKENIFRGLSLSFAAKAKAFVQSIVARWDPVAAGKCHYVWKSPEGGGIYAHLVTNPVNKAATEGKMLHARKCASHELKSIAAFLSAQWDGPLRCHAPLACVVQYACLTFFCSCALPLNEEQDACLVQDAAPVAATTLRQAFETMNLEPPVSRLSIPLSFRLFLSPNGMHWATGMRRLFPVEGPRSGDPGIATALLRPELVKGVAGRLCCSAFDPGTPIAVRKRSDRDVIKAGRKITHVQIAALTQFLSTDGVSGKTTILDGAMVGHLHRFGINLRYLAQVAFTLIRVATKDADGGGATGGGSFKSRSGPVTATTVAAGAAGGGGKQRNTSAGGSKILRPWAAAESKDAPRQLLIMKVVTAIFDEVVARVFRSIVQADLESMFFPPTTATTSSSSLGGGAGKKSLSRSAVGSPSTSVGTSSSASPSSPLVFSQQEMTNVMTKLIQLLLGESDGSAQFWADRVDPMLASKFPSGDFSDRITLEDLDLKHLLRRISDLLAVEINAKDMTNVKVESVGLRVKKLCITPPAKHSEDLERVALNLQQLTDATAAVQQQLSSVRTMMMMPMTTTMHQSPPMVTAALVRTRDEGWLLRHLFRIQAVSRSAHATSKQHIAAVALNIERLLQTPSMLSTAQSPGGRRSLLGIGDGTVHPAADIISAGIVCSLTGARFDDALSAVDMLKERQAGSGAPTSVQLWASLLAVEVNIGAGRHDAALKSCEELLAMTKAAAREGRSHDLEVADSLHLVADLYSATSSSITYQRQARELLLERYQIVRKVLPPQDPLVLSSISDLAASHIRMEEEQEAIGLYDKLLGCGERWIGCNSPFVVDILGKLGHACVSVGNFEAAQSVFGRVLTLCDSHYSQDLPVKARARLNMCEMHLAKGNVSAAWHEMKLAQSIGLGLPFNDPVLLAQLQLEAKLHLLASQFDLALGAWTKILDARERTFGPQDPSTCDAMFEIAVIMFRQKKFHECWHVLDVCLTIRKQILSEHHPITAFTLAWLARSEAAAGNIVESVEYFEQSAAMFDTMVPVTDAMNISFPKMRAQCLLDIASLLIHDVKATTMAASSNQHKGGPLDIKHNLAMGTDPQRVLQRALRYLQAAHDITLAQFQDTRHPSLRTIESLTVDCKNLSEAVRGSEQTAVKLQEQAKLLDQWTKIPEKDAEVKGSKDPLWYRNAHRIYKLQKQGGSDESSTSPSPL